MRKVYILPNLFTAGSLFSGMLAIFSVYNTEVEQACWLILLSALLDVADGAVARLTRTQSAFGMHFDSLSDAVAFGAAPAIIAYHAFSGLNPHMAAAVCGLYAVFGALRLARFNVQATREEKKTFTGLPIPGAALTVISLVWFFEINKGIAASLPLGLLLPPALLFISYMMVSKVPFYGFKSIPLAGRAPFELLVTSVVIACLLFTLKQHLDVVLLVTSWGYVAASIVMGLMQMRHPHMRPAHAGLNEGYDGTSAATGSGQASSTGSRSTQD